MEEGDFPYSVNGGGEISIGEDTDDEYQCTMDTHNKRYQNNLLSRFGMVNQYCDTTIREPITFNSTNKVWYGGTDVLDYVVCYATKEDPEGNVPDHWHYVSFGLSDIHGMDFANGHTSSVVPPTVQGLDFELTFRLRAKLEGTPPGWPVDLLQKLARYIQFSHCAVVPGDHITWNNPLHGNLDVPCEINHMLVALDASIPTIETPTGPVSFHQVVGATYSEVEIAQKWNSTALLNLFKENPELGGKALVTDIFRKQSIVELHPEVEAVIAPGIARDGSDLNGVAGRALWTQNAKLYCNETHWWALSEYERRQYIEFESTPSVQDSVRRSNRSRKDAVVHDVDQLSKLFSHTNLDEEEHTEEAEDVLNHLPRQMRDRLIFPTKVQLIMSPETAKILPLALKGRVNHQRHFTIKDSTMDDVVTFVPRNMPGSFTTDDSPFGACGPWLHIQLDEFALNQIVDDTENLFSTDSISQFPKFLSWSEAGLGLTILDIRDWSILGHSSLLSHHYFSVNISIARLSCYYQFSLTRNSQSNQSGIFCDKILLPFLLKISIYLLSN